MKLSSRQPIEFVRSRPPALRLCSILAWRLFRAAVARVRLSFMDPPDEPAGRKAAHGVA